MEYRYQSNYSPSTIIKASLASGLIAALLTTSGCAGLTPDLFGIPLTYNKNKANQIYARQRAERNEKEIEIARDMQLGLKPKFEFPDFGLGFTPTR
jgi:hypothetical protein